MKSPLVAPTYILAILALAAACGSKPSPPGRLENVGGSSGREPDASASGVGPDGGGSEPMLDAGLPDAAGAPDGGGLDAGPDAAATQPDAAPAEEEGCVPGTDGPGGPGNGSPGNGGPGPGGPGNDPSEECVSVDD